MYLAEQSRRADYITAAIINQGISYQTIYGTSFAAAFMKTQGVQQAIAMRVLSQPHSRRNGQ